MFKELDLFNSLYQAFATKALANPERIIWEQIIDDNNRKVVTAKQALERVQKIAVLLRDLGIKKGDRVGILSNTRPEWLEVDLAILALGAVSVSIYHTLTADEIGYILYDSEVKLVFAENLQQAEKIKDIISRRFSIPATEERAGQEVSISLPNVICFESEGLLAGMHALSSADRLAVSELDLKTERTELANIVYTSGTTGAPKGVMQTQGNHLSNVRQVGDSNILDGIDSIFLFLPLAHSFAKLMAYIAALTDIKLVFPRVISTTNSKMEPHILSKDMQISGAMVFPVVPRLLEKIQLGISAKPGLLGKVLKTIIAAGNRIYKAKSNSTFVNPLDSLIFLLSLPLRKKLANVIFGANFKYAISGGAKLNPDVQVFFDCLKIEVLEGFGLTETCVATNINRPGNKKIGSVGPALADDIEVKILEDGEVAFRGPNVSIGYLNRKTATQKAWDTDGFFYTGDLGRLDQGFLYITGRKKEIIISSYGKKVSPQEIEDRIKTDSLISAAVVVGEGKPFLTVLLSINWIIAEKHGIEKGDSHSAKLRELIDKHLTIVNSNLASYEEVRGYYVLAEDFTIENGFLTPTFKIKRSLVTERFAAEIESLY